MASIALNNGLSVNHLSCVRGDRVLFKNLSFSLTRGELLHIQGENGSGKTTLLRTICGLSLPVAGDVLWNQQSIKSLAEDYYGQIVYIGHQLGIKDDLSPIENILFSLALSGYAINRQHAMVALEALGVARCADLPTRVLSQGQKRRTALAQLWLQNQPEQTALWILDEPYAALDIKTIKNLTQHIDKYVKDGGIVIFTSHQSPDFDTQFVKTLTLDTHA